MQDEEKNLKEYSPKTNAFKTLIDKIYIHRMPSYGNKIFFSLGFLALTCLTVLVATGIVLAFMGQTWWLTNPWGIYFRSVHLWTVQAFFVILILHIIVGFSTSGFRPPRRMVWVFGAIIFALVLIQTEFGYGLRGDFSSQYRAVAGADFWNGAHLGYWLNPLNYSQAFAIHVVIIPLAILFLFVLHYILVHTYGISKPLRKDIPYKEVPANHNILFIRGGVLVVAILVLALFFHSPYVPAVRIANIANQNPTLVATTMLQEFNHTSGTATYFDSIDPYTFNTRSVFVVTPYKQFLIHNQNNNAWTTFVNASPAQQKAYIQQAKSYVTATSTNNVGTSTNAVASTTNPVISMIHTLMPIAKSGLYQSLLNQENQNSNYTYTLRFLLDMNVLHDKAASLHMDTAEYGMAKDENEAHGIWVLPPGSWWLLPLGWSNSAFNLLENPYGDQIAGEILGALLLIFILFPYIPYLNRLPELLPLAPIIQKEPKEKERGEEKEPDKKENEEIH
ncbi:MAG TPA: hypothetical protein ENI56_00640 [Candidatus Kaiserbacteria bacterium]|mgnify:CR=1 FL=1|nr:hypothetical protein [Candidatus Kaiserbacteria bacterium]